MPDSINIDQRFEQQIEGISEKALTNNDYSEIAENLDYLKSDKINLNSATAYELKQLSFLNVFQINNFINYRNRNGELYSIYELNSIQGFDEKTVRSIMQFVKIEAIAEEEWQLRGIKKTLKYGSNKIITRFQTQFQTPKGYISSNDSSEAKYQGSKHKLYTKYLFNSSEKLRFGITLENDAGEQFGWEHSKTGFDFSSFHIEFKNLSIFDKLIIGDYNLQFGQGLTIWSSFSTGKSSDATNIIKLGRGVTPFSGTNENIFFRGISATISFNNFHISPFISYNLIDGGVNMINPEEYNTYESGLHRTINEIERKNSLTKTDFGINTDYDLKNAKIGITLINTKFDQIIAKGDRNYQYFNFNDNESTSIAAHYLWSHNSVILSGEHSTNVNGAWATLHNISVNAIPEFSFLISYRNYQNDYFSAINSPFSEFSTSGEKGYYFGVNSELHKYLKISAYIDIFEKTWLQYQKDAPTKGYESLMQFDSYINYTSSAYFRIKYEKKSRNLFSETNFINQLKDETKLNLRLQFNKLINSNFSISSRAEYVHYTHKKNENGWLIYQNIKYNLPDLPLSFFSRIAFFDTEGWNSRIYAYENDVLYIFTVPAYYDKGIKYYLGVKYELNKNFSFWTRIAHIKYENLTSIGSGDNQITGNQKTEIKVQMRIKF